MCMKRRTKQDRTGYKSALDAVIKIRLQRKKIYGDEWKNTADWEILAMMKQKISRLEMFIIKRPHENLYENRKDTLIDLINWSLFLLENSLVEDEN